MSKAKRERERARTVISAPTDFRHVDGAGLPHPRLQQRPYIAPLPLNLRMPPTPLPRKTVPPKKQGPLADVNSEQTNSKKGDQQAMELPPRPLKPQHLKQKQVQGKAPVVPVLPVLPPHPLPSNAPMQPLPRKPAPSKRQRQPSVGLRGNSSSTEE